MLDNYAIADQFSLLSKLMDIHQENGFKAKSYGSAAYAIEKTPEQIAEVPRDKIQFLKGIGESTAKKIIEILETGKIQVLEDLISKTPEGILEMMQIKGLGPKKVSAIWKEMEIETVGELLYACNENRLLLYKGFGEKTQKNVADAIEFYFKHQGHFLYSEVEGYAMLMDKSLKTEFPDNQIFLCGEFARQIPTIEKLIWITNISPEKIKEFYAAANFQIVEETEIELILKGEENVTIQIQYSSPETIHQVRFENCCSIEFLSAWKNKYSFTESSYESEEEIFIKAGVNFIPPFLREDPNSIEKYKSKPVPQPIQASDICAIIHSHSNWSDGLNTIEEMAKECIKRNLEYLVISDHSKIAFYANGLSEEKVKEQHIYIDQLNAKLAPFRIYKSIECDILNDGALDYSPTFLSTFDIVIASVHSNLKMSEEKAMQRLLVAIENPYTSILGHPTGRLLLSRKGYPIDHEKIIDACLENDVVIEINAHPRRLDLDWSWISKAQEKGVLLSINPDAHSLDGFNDIRYGVLAAQKGALLKENNLSSFTRNEFEHFLVEQHKKRGMGY
jgi:DNA polymerase (family 10)